MKEELEDVKSSAISSLERGLADHCADNLDDVILNLDDGTCDYLELIPILEKIAERDLFCYWDDNGAGGAPHPEPSLRTSFRKQALKSIENIRENAQFEADSEIAQALKSVSHSLIKTTLEDLGKSQCADKQLIPILEKIARKDVYDNNSYLSYASRYYRNYPLGELARKAIQTILENYEQRK